MKKTAPKKAVAASNKYSFAVDFFATIYPISVGFKNKLQALSFNTQMKKGDYLVRKGDICTTVYLIKKGVMRGYIEQGKKEITTWISCENEMVTSISSFFNGTPAKENIKALEACELEGINFTDLQCMYKNYPEANILARLILEQYYQDAEDRAFISKLSTAKEKYEHLSKSKHGRMLNMVPLKYVASFLGMRLETLIRLRASIALKNKKH
jgi:CRP-like cAMP-binding protein